MMNIGWEKAYSHSGQGVSRIKKKLRRAGEGTGQIWGESISDPWDIIEKSRTPANVKKR